MNPISLLMRQLTLEGIGLDQRGRMTRIPSVAADEIPRVYVAQHDLGMTRLYRDDLPDELCALLDGLADDTLFDDRPRIRHILATAALITDIWLGSSYVVEAIPEPDTSPDVTRIDRNNYLLIGTLDPAVLAIDRTVYAILADGRIASTCVSVRENAEAAEAWVQTAPEYRRRGFARQVTSAWAHDVRLVGKIAFYSHAWDNASSLAVAQSLNLRKFIDAVGYL